MFRALAAAAAATVLACSSPAPSQPAPVGNTSTTGPASTAITGPDDAIARFIAAWTAEVRPRMAGHKDPLIGQIDETMREPDARKRYSAELKPCRDASRGMVELMAQSKHDFVLYGTIAAAHAHDRCWAVDYICCMKGDAGGLLDPDTGALLVVWRIPEG